MVQKYADSTKPDLEEGTNVAATHARLTDASAAAEREKVLRENGMEPVSLWVVLGCFAVVLIAGGVFFKGGNYFNNAAFVAANYQQGEEPGGDTGPVLEPAFKAYMAKGKGLYAQKCAACHGGDGNGNPGFPPLTGSEYVVDNARVVTMIALNGVAGPIVVKGKTYNSNMAAQAVGLNEYELAGLITYIRNSWGNEGDVMSIEQAAEILADSDSRGGSQLSGDEAIEMIQDKLKAAPLSKEQLVDKKTGIIVDATEG